MSLELDTIVVTGFGLFRDHKTNPSWEAIRDGKLRVDRPNIKIVTEQVEVSYKAVDDVVNKLWSMHKPVLMVHIGLAAFEKSIRLEKVARHGPYIHDDITNNAPHIQLRQYETQNDDGHTSSTKFTCKPCSFGAKESCLNLDRVNSKLNELHKLGTVPIPSKTSVDAGLYVCEYIYQKSLQICDRTVFIHVPNVEDFTIEQISDTIGRVIELLVDELNEIT